MQLQVFKNLHFEVRWVVIKNEPHFVANDVCKALGYSNARDALSRHCEEDVVKHDTLTNGGKQTVNYVNESGLYALIFGSALPQAKAFKKWITSEVLPSIRKQGFYGELPQEIDFLKEKIALQQELITTKTQLIALQKESIKSLKKQRQAHSKLTKKEEIFKLLSEGKSQSQAAREVGISRSGVAYYVSKERQNERA